MTQRGLFDAGDDDSELDRLWREAEASLRRHGSYEAMVAAQWQRIVASDPERWKDFGR